MMILTNAPTLIFLALDTCINDFVFFMNTFAVFLAHTGPVVDLVIPWAYIDVRTFLFAGRMDGFFYFWVCVVSFDSDLYAIDENDIHELAM